MAHFAQLDADNVVLQVIVVHNNELMVNGEESEAKGIDFCHTHFGADTRWIQTSYNGNFRKNLALPGYTYDTDLDAFIPPKLYASWVLDQTVCQWVAPQPYPTDGKKYFWNEDLKNWEELTV
jgi:hypothetical protein